MKIAVFVVPPPPTPMNMRRTAAATGKEAGRCGRKTAFKTKQYHIHLYFSSICHKLMHFCQEPPLKKPNKTTKPTMNV